MGESKRRKEARGTSAPDIVHKRDPLAAGTEKSEISASDRAHITRTRLDCRKQSRKVLQAAKAATDTETRKRAMAVLNRGTGFIFDRQLQDFFEGNPIGRQTQSKIACTMGCYSCCHLSVTTTPAEAITIALHVQSDAESVQKVAEVAPQIAGLNSEQRLNKQVYCPLLKKGLCSVHEIRPLKCRRLFSFDEKACQKAFCGSAAERTIKPKLPIFALPSLIEPAITDGVRLACADEGLQDCSVELVSALSLILSDPTAIDRWFQGEAVFTPVTEE